MRPNSMRQWRILAVLAVVSSMAVAAPAAAQLQGDLHYAWGYTLVPDPPLASGPTTLLLYGNYPTGCGEIQEASVADTAHVSIRLHSTVCVDTSDGRWVGRFDLGQLAGGVHTVAIRLTMDEPETGVTEHEGALTFEVMGSGSPGPPPPSPPPPSPPPPPEPQPYPLLLQSTSTDPYPPTPDRPMALILGGYAPFGCPVATSATVVDSSHLSLTLSPTAPCPGDSASKWWSQRFELGLQREGHHAISVAITLDGESPETVNIPADFLVAALGSGWGPPPDSLDHMLSSSRPNPFAQETRFSVSTDGPENADVAVYDVLGRRVSRVFHGRLPSGTTELAWNGYRDDGTRAAAGVYFYRLEMRGRVVSRRLILLRQH